MMMASKAASGRDVPIDTRTDSTSQNVAHLWHCATLSTVRAMASVRPRWTARTAPAIAAIAIAMVIMPL